MKLRAPRRFLLLATAAALGLPLLAVAPTSAGAATGCSAPTSLWVTIATPTRVIYPQRVTVNGYAYQSDHSPACGAAVSIHAVSGKGAGSVQYASKVGPTGRFSVALWIGRNTTYTGFASYPGLGLHSSVPHLVVLYPRIGITSLTPTTVKRGGTLYIAGTVQPGRLGGLPWLQVFTKTGVWEKKATAYAMTQTGVWSLKWLVPTSRHTGIASIRMVYPATATHAQGTSSSRTITVV